MTKKRQIKNHVFYHKRKRNEELDKVTDAFETEHAFETENAFETEDSFETESA